MGGLRVAHFLLALISNRLAGASFGNLVSGLRRTGGGVDLINAMLESVGAVVVDGFLIFSDKVITFFEASYIESEMIT